MAYIYTEREFTSSVAAWTFPDNAGPDDVFKFVFTTPAASGCRLFIAPEGHLGPAVVVEISAGSLRLWDVNYDADLIVNSYDEFTETILEEGTLEGTVTCELYMDSFGNFFIAYTSAGSSGDLFTNLSGTTESFTFAGNPLYVWGSLYGYSDSITAVSAEITKWNGFLEQYESESNNYFEPLSSTAFDVNNFSSNTFAPLTTDGRTYNRATGDATFEALTTLSDTVDNATGYAVFQPLGISAGKYPSNTPTVCFNQFSYMQGGGVVLYGERAGTYDDTESDTQFFKPLDGLGSEGECAQGVAEFPNVGGYGFYFFYPDGEFTKSHGGYNIKASGYSLDPNSAYLSLGGYSTAGYSGARLDSTLSGYELSIAGAFTGVMRAKLKLSGYALNALGYTGGVGTARLSSSGYALSTYSGGRFSGGLGEVWTGSGVYQVLGSGLVGAYGSSRLSLRSRYTLLAGATAHGLSYARLIGPSLRAVSGARAQLELSGYGLQAYDLVTTELVGPTYVVNIRTGAVTRYENWPVDRVLRVGGTLFGVSRTGLYRLREATGEVTGKLSTFYTDFGNSRLKSCSDLYVHGTLTGALVSTLQSDESETSYNYPALPKSTGGIVRTAKAKLGKGLRGYSFCVSVEGADFKTIDSLEVLHNETGRRVNK